MLLEPKKEETKKLIDELKVSMACSMSRQDEPNPRLSLATLAGKMAVSFLPRITCCVPDDNSALFPYDTSFVDQACLVQVARWLDICMFMDLDSSQSLKKKTRNKRENLFNIQPS